MRIVTATSIALIWLVSGCTTPSVVDNETAVSRFRQARNEGDRKAMHDATTKLFASGILAKGMTVDQVEALLGQPDNTTGIYCPGGSSIGYGPKTPTVSNYGEFYWLHFRSEDYMKDKQDHRPPVLLSWD